MNIRTVSAAAFVSAVLASLCTVPVSARSLDSLGVNIVRDGESREYSYSDKEAGFYYGQTSEDDFSDWYAGWNIRAKRIFADYRLYVDGRKVLFVAIKDVIGSRVGIELVGNNVINPRKGCPDRFRL